MDLFLQSTGLYKRFNLDDAPKGIVSGIAMLKALVLDIHYPTQIIRQSNIETSSVLARVSAYKKGLNLDNGLNAMRFRFGDTIFIEMCLRDYCAYFLPDVMSVYRKHSGGATATSRLLLTMMHDATIVKICQACNIFGWDFNDSIDYFSEKIFQYWRDKLIYCAKACEWDQVHGIIRHIIRWPLRRVFFKPKNFLFLILSWCGMLRFTFVQQHVMCGRGWLFKGWQAERLSILNKYKAIDVSQVIFCEK